MTNLLPLFVQVFFTFGLLLAMGFARTGVVRRREVHLRDVALGQNNWPLSVQKLSNCFHNQLETPIFLYLAVVIIELEHLRSSWFTPLMWFYVVTRFLHAYVEITSNRVPVRFAIFLSGALSLIALWVAIAGVVLTA
jgi:hypothetical protein